MNQPTYKDGWKASKVVEYLLADPDFVEWSSPQGEPPEWIASDGSVLMMMDDNDARWLATWKFVAERSRVTRTELLAISSASEEA
jgi:hypothetical protein